MPGFVTNAKQVGLRIPHVNISKVDKFPELFGSSEVCREIPGSKTDFTDIEVTDAMKAMSGWRQAA